MMMAIPGKLASLLKAKVSSVTATVELAAGMVKVTTNYRKEALDISVDYTLVKPEDNAALPYLIKKAINLANEDIERQVTIEFNKLIDELHKATQN